jgi:hypothetical protein
VSFVETPHRSSATGNLCLGHRYNDLVQRQIRLPGNQIQQKHGVIFQGRNTSTAWPRHNTSRRFPALHPNHHDARADPVEFRRLASRCPRGDRFNHAFTQVHRIRLRHCSPPQPNQCCQTRALATLWESFPIQNERKTLIVFRVKLGSQVLRPNGNFCGPEFVAITVKARLSLLCHISHDLRVHRGYGARADQEGSVQHRDATPDLRAPRTPGRRL